MEQEEGKACEKPCECTDPLLPVNNVIISLMKSVRQKPPDQKDYLKPNDDDLWTLKLESPFPHYWTFGYNKHVPIINLTTPSEAKVVFASGRFAVVYDYEYETMLTLEGHRNIIKCMSGDGSGRFIATCDGNHGNKVIVWDLQQCSPVHVIYEFENTSGPLNIWLSPCARYVVVLRKTRKQQELHFYNWTLNTRDAKIMVVFDENLDLVKKLTFSLDNPDFLMITTERQVVFLTYIHASKLTPPKIRIHNGEYTNDPVVGKFTESTYLSGSHLCYSGTDSGHVRVWSDLDYYDEMCEEKEISNFKNEMIYHHLTNSKITVINAVDSYLVVGNEMGKIQFFTHSLILVYWFEHSDLSSILSLSFNLQDRTAPVEKKDPHKRRANTLFVLGTLCRKKKRDITHFQKAEDVCYVLPRKLEDEPETFAVKDCLVVAKNEKVAYINFINKSIEYLLENFVTDVVAIECHPLRDYLVLASSNGFLYLVDYVMNQEIVRRTLLPLNVTSGGSFSSKGVVLCIKYSLDGYSLVCGLSNGHIVFLSPVMLDYKFILKYSTRPIRILRFSPDGKLLAACDTTNMYFIKVRHEGPELIAKQKTHGRVITDILFFIKVNGEITCFSTGKDKNLVQYDIARTLSERKVVIKKSVRVEQRSDPLCLSLAADPRKIIMGKSDFKLQMINVDEMVYTNNKHSPTLKNPVNKLFLVNPSSPSEYLFFTACNHIGLVKLPLEPNPYKWISIHVSENKISHTVFSKDKNFVFTLSKGEGTVNMWRVMSGVLEVLASNVGNEEAFKYENLLGPDRDFLLQEIKDYFVYASLMHQGDMKLLPNYIKPIIPVCEVPDILRAMGCFMTNYEMECAIRKGEPREKFKVEERKIDFGELVELYASGREFSCVDLKDIRKAFYRICSMKPDLRAKDDKKTISRNDFIHILTAKGETMQMCEAIHFLRTLADPMNKEKSKVEMAKQKLADRNEDDQSADFLFLPEVSAYAYYPTFSVPSGHIFRGLLQVIGKQIITCEYFIRNILGLTRHKHDVKANWEKQKERRREEEERWERAVEKEQTAELAYRHKYTELGIKKGKNLVNEDACANIKTERNTKK